MNRSDFLKLFYSLPLIYNFNKREFFFDKNYLIGKGNPSLVGKNYKVLPKVNIAFLKMKNEALKSGIKLEIVSGYRSFDRQRKIWNRKFELNLEKGLTSLENVSEIMKYSTIPGTSRHHWGTDIDIIDSNEKVNGDVLITNLYLKNGPFSKMYEWLTNNSKRFGFHEVYTNNINRKGFLFEPWHYSYAPLSKKYIKEFINIDLYKIIHDEKNIFGKDVLNKKFLKKYISDYVLGISDELL